MRREGSRSAVAARRLVALGVLLLASAGTRPAQAQAIRGGVFEDVNYGGGAGRDSASASGVARPNARVELYSSAGAFSGATVTGAAGNYSFTGLAAGTYYVRVVNASVSSSRSGYVAGTHLAVQTFRTNAGSGTAVPVTDYVGGTAPNLADPGNGGAGTVFNTTTFVFTAGLSGTAQSVAAVVLGATDVVGVDFGFNFDTIVNTNDTGQGSLRQFLANANGLGNAGLAIVGQSPGFDVSVFMISDGSAHPGQRAGLPNQLTAGTAIITPATPLPVITGAQTSLDGTTQTSNIGNTNPAVLGAGGTVGVGALPLGQVAGPEVAIRDTGGLAAGVEMNANGVRARGLAIYGFGSAAPDGGILVDSGASGALIEGNVLGTTANSFTDPGAALYNRAGVYVNGAVNGTIQNNAIGYNGVTGIYLATGSTGWSVTNNDVRDNGTTTTDGDGITLNAAATNSVTGNRVTGSSSQGIVVTVAGASGNVIANNTVTGNGVGTTSGLVQSTGITMRSGAATTTLDRNIVTANYGAGLQVNNGASGTVITQNSFFANGTITSRNGQAATGQIGIDLNAAGDNIDLGTAPFRTLNDAGDADNGGNALLNFPILSTAYIAGGNLTMSGFARPGSTIEFFTSDGDPSGFGEGQTYLFTAVEGSGADADAGTGTYGPGAINGLVQGTDTTNRFSFTVPLPGGVSVGTRMTATATLGGQTSEFSGVVLAAVPPGITVNPTSGLTTTESAGTATFTVVLDSQPSANVTIGLSSNDLTEGTVSPASVTFTNANWNVAQTVTVTGVDDAVADGNIAYTIVTAAATSTDPAYNGLNAADVSVTNMDNDVVGATVSPTSGLTTTEAGGTAAFTIVLTSQPTANVTIGLSSSDLTEGTVAPASVTFLPGNWNVAQTVTVTGADDALVDGNVGYTIVTAAAISSDPAYSGFDPSDVSVTNNDDDVVGVTVSPTSGLTTTEAGGTAAFTIVLTSQPTANVTIGLSSSDLTEGTVAPASVTFLPGNWNVAQTVTVTGADDALVDGSVGYTVVTAAAVSTDPAYSGFDPSDVSVTNADNDVAGITVNPTSGLTTTEALGTATFTVVLNTQPTANVTIGLSSNDLTEGTVAPASVTFTPGDWNLAQTVTVTGVDDAVADGDIVYTILTAAAVSSDPAYGGYDPADVSVTNMDDDVAGVTVSPTSGLTTTEAAGTATFTVVLTSQPAANVTIGLSSSDLTEGTVAPASVTFTSGDWNIAQTVTVTGVDDAVADGNIAYTIITAPAASTDAGYSGFDPSDVSVVNTDDDLAGITVSPTSGLTTTETGGTATFTVVLATQPTANVIIGLSSSDLTEGTVAPASVIFTPADWNVAQTVTVAGTDDAVVDGNIAYTIVTAAAVSADAAYSGFDPSDVSVTNTDDDAVGVTVTPTSGLTTTEAGGTATFTVVLTSLPAANVTIGLSSGDLTEGTVAPASVTFTPGTWNVAQTITVTGVDDAVVDGNVAYTIVTGAAVSGDPAYSGFNPSDVSVTNNDDDVAGVTVNPTSGLMTTEGGGTATFTVVLNSQPTANVTIGLSSSDLTEGTLAPGSLTFTPGNWDVVQTVTVTGVDDALADGNVGYTVVTAAAVSTDPSYNGFNPSDVSVTNNDDDAAGVTVNPTSGLTTTEAGGTATFTVVLNSQPSANVTVGLSSSDLTEGTVAPASVTFLPGNWNVAQTVTVTGVNDAAVDGNVAYTIVTAAAVSGDPGYSGFNPPDVSVTNNDDDAAGVTVSPTAGLTTTEAGGTATFTAVLTSQPTGNVTIGLSSGDLTEGTVAPASLTFTPGNWNVAQTATVTGVNDALIDGNVAYTIVTGAAVSTDPAYNGFDPSDVSVTNNDDDVAGVTVSPTSGLTTTEAGGMATFTLVLTSQPTGSVTVGLSSSDLTEGTVSPAGVTFTSGNWNVAQTVTVTGVDDAVVDGNIGYTVVTAPAVSPDPAYNGFDPSDVSVTNTDDDVPPAQSVRLDLTADPTRVEVGEATTFTLRVGNLTATPIPALDIARELPPGFAILPNTATRDGNPFADSGTPQLAIGALAGLVDSNGNGHADPGEPGYTVIRWRAVVGAGVAPGEKTAAATAVTGCSTCAVSNRAEASLSVEESGLLARGTLLGRVFEDRNRDGFQDPDEPGILGATVALDDGTSVTTDADGLFHVPDVDSGQRLLKLDIGRFPHPATPTTDVATVARVSGGLITSVRFGVAFDRDTLKVGAPPVRGLALVADDLDLGVDVAGNAVRSAVVVNGAHIPVRTADARTESADSGEILRLSGDRFDPPAVFKLEPADRAGIRRWSFEIRSSADSLVRVFEGTGAPPARVEWSGDLRDGGVLQGGEVYAHQLKLEYGDGSVVEGPRRTFGVDRQSAFGLTMTGDAFATGSAQLTARAMEALSAVARDIRRSAGDTVFVEGHTDSVGSAAANLKLSRERAQAAAKYLVDHERIARDRLAVRGYGESRPIATNSTPEGREINRRVEIFGNRTEVQRSPLRDVYRGRAAARVNGQDVAVDSVGRFAVRVPARGDSLEVVMTDRSEQTTRAVVRLPKLQVLEPRGETVLPYGGETPNAKVDPLNPSPLAETEVAGLRPPDGTRRAASVHLKAKTDPGARASVDGRALTVASDGTFEADLPLHLGRNAFGVVLQDSTGVMTVANVVVSALDRTSEGGEVVAVEKIPDMTVYLPPSGAVLSSPVLGLSGETGAGNKVFANGDSIPVAPNGTFAGTITLPEGRSKVSIDVVDPAGRRGHLERFMEVRSKRMFLVAIADGVVGGGAGPRGETGTWTDGRLAYQLRGWIAGRVLVTSAFDSERRTWGNLFRDLGTAETERLITNLDPDRLYPVFGDASSATYATSPNGGRFYLALESNAVRGSVGDFPIALDDVELAAFHRTLYGAQVQVQPNLLAKAGDPSSHGTGTSLKVFGAEAGHVHVRDVLEATGGTLYYLSRRDIIEGSVQATICVRDRNTGLPLQRIPQARGVDFVVKEIEGRVIFNRPVASTSENGSLLNGGQLGGDPVSIEVDYEANASPTENAAVGGRLSQALGPVQLGGTVIQDETGASPYTLHGADARLKLGPHSWLGAEVAASEGQAGRAFLSEDGGFSFAPFDTGATQLGGAWKVATEVDAGDWLGAPGRVTVGGFVKRVDDGFVSDSENDPLGSRQIGARAEINGAKWGVWSTRYDQERRFASTSLPGQGESDLFGAQWRRDARRMGVAAEFQSRSVDSTDAQNLAGVRLWYQLAESLRTTVEHQQSLGGADLGQTALGVSWGLPMGLSLDARASDGTEGRAFRGGASFAVGGRRVYLRQELLDGGTGPRAMTVIGAQTPLGRMSRAYSEYQWLNQGGAYAATSVIGAEQGWRFTNGIGGRVYGERGGRAGASASLPHTTVALELGYGGKLPLGFTTRGEYRRMDAGSLDHQYAIATHVDLRLIGGFSLLADHRLSEAFPNGPGATTRYEERGVGMAYRQPRSDRVEALAHFTDLQDRRPEDPSDSLRATNGLTVAALEVRMRLWPDLEWGLKGAARVMREGDGSIAPSDAHSALFVSRMDYSVTGPFRLGVQYQQLAQREVGDRRGGLLQEVTWDPRQHVRFGVGYNFSKISGDEFDRSTRDAHGWFVRAQTRY